MEFKPRTARGGSGEGGPLRDIVLLKGKGRQVAEGGACASGGVGKPGRGPSEWGGRGGTGE